MREAAKRLLRSGAQSIVYGRVKLSNGTWQVKEMRATCAEEEERAIQEFGARSISFGRQRQFGATGGPWVTRGIPIFSEEEEELAAKCYAAFCKQYDEPAKRGMFLDIPVFQEDVRYRCLRLKETCGLTSEQVLDMFERDASPAFIDPGAAKDTFDSLAENSSVEKAQDIVQKHPGVLASGEGIGNNVMQAEIMANMLYMASR